MEQGVRSGVHIRLNNGSPSLVFLHGASPTALGASIDIVVFESTASSGRGFAPGRAACSSAKPRDRPM
jgi:hypothetical protein